MAIPVDVLDFLTGRIDSVESLYVLLLLQRDPRLAWTGSAVGSELHIGAETEHGAQAVARAYALEPTEVVEQVQKIRDSRSDGA